MWALSGTPHEIGTCVTAQMYTFDARMNALIALLNLKGANELAQKFNDFYEASRSGSSTRNRIVHNVWQSDDESGWQLSVTAGKRLLFSASAKDIQKLMDDHRAIEQTVVAFFNLRDELRDLLPSLPGTGKLAIEATFQPRHRK